MRRVVWALPALLAAALFATPAQAQQRFGNFGGFNVGFGNPGFAFPAYGFGYPAYGYGYGYGMPAYGLPVVAFSSGAGFPRYNYATDPFGGSPNGADYNYWVSQQAAHGNISWQRAAKLMGQH